MSSADGANFDRDDSINSRSNAATLKWNVQSPLVLRKARGSWAMRKRLVQIRTALIEMTSSDTDGTVRLLLHELYNLTSVCDARLLPFRRHISTILKSASRNRIETPPRHGRIELTRREVDVLQMIASGMSNKRIAQALGITPETVKSHTKNIFLKLDCRTRAQAVSRADARGFL
jgi:DNA-binding NarL/FixJ family response regulator